LCKYIFIKKDLLYKLTFFRARTLTLAQHADDGYYRRENFGISFVPYMVLIYLQDGYGSRDGESERTRVGVWG